MMKESTQILSNEKEFLKYLKSKFVLIHRSNIFYRDIYHGVISYLADHGKKVGHQAADTITGEVLRGLEQSGILRNIDHQSWLLEYPDFALPQVEKQAVK